MISAEDMAAMEARVASMMQEQLAQQRAALSQEAQAGLAGMAAEVAALRAVADRQQAEGTGLVTENAALRARITQGTAVLVQKDQELLELQGQLRQFQAGGGVPLPGENPVRDALLVELREQVQATQLAYQAEATARAAAEQRLAEGAAAWRAASPDAFGSASAAAVAAGAALGYAEDPVNAGLRDFAYRQGTIHSPEMFSGNKEDWRAWAQGFRDFWAISPGAGPRTRAAFRLAEEKREEELPQEEVEVGGFAPFSDLLLPHLRRLLPKGGLIGALGSNTPDGHGLQLWRAIAKAMDPAMEGNFSAEAMALQVHQPVAMARLLEVIPAWEAKVTELRAK